MRNKILLIEPDQKSSFELCLVLENSGFVITGVVPYIYNAVKSIDLEQPDIIMIDAPITDHIAEFVSSYIKLPLIVISDQFEKEILKYSDKIRILDIIIKPYNIREIKTHITIAFNKL